MQYGPGHSAQVWREYIPQAEVWFGEYDYECVQHYKSDLEAMGLAGIVTGDQADIPTLESWVATTGGGFDLIVDDGGHTNMQLYNSFAVLFTRALKPGGLYVMEDIMTCRTPSYRDGDGQHVTLDIIKDWMDDLVMSRLHRKNVKTPPGERGLAWRRPPRLKSVECSTHYCAFTKCFDDDDWCNAIEEETQPLEPHDPRAPAAAAAVTAAGGVADGEAGQAQVPAALGAKAAKAAAPAKAVIFKRGAGAGGEGAAAKKRRSKRRRAEALEEEAASQAGRSLKGAAADGDGEEEVDGVELGAAVAGGSGLQQRAAAQQPKHRAAGGISGVRSGALWRHHGMQGR
ncbi:hypothetical protein HXX76_012282 [Chlamydomonas incerta]|uniref:Uncharacterized protein n=1 Tax=Chlamydomonas incerta TaxID=51695 RepID=A0A835VWF4_CHLIN|nr:hypothetical protein HXX76_012282 [Chlamydomonas incerta]|eukprot:KAG2427631.1 hypothetical protein HXX76_012282 [Chlamydomonas incerta]